MGAYGSPDTFPYDKMERKCHRCGKVVVGKYCPECGAKMDSKIRKEKTSSSGKSKSGNPIFAIVLDIIVTLFIFFVGTDKSMSSFFGSAIFPALFSAVVYVIKIILSAIKGKDNSYNIKGALISALITIGSFIVFGLTSK